MSKRLYIIIVALLLSAVTTVTYGQQRKKSNPFTKGLYLGAKFGPSWVLASFTDNNKKYGGDIYMAKEVVPWMDVRLEVGVGHSGGKQVTSYLTSSTNYINAAVSIDAYLVTLITGISQNQYGVNSPRLFDPYIGIGIGGYPYQAKQTWDDHEDEISWRNNEVSATTAYFFGMIGVRLKISNHWCAILEAQGDVPFSRQFDAHDGYSFNDYVTKEQAQAEGSWVEMKGYDCFGTLMIGASYMFNSSRWQNNKYNRKVYLQNRKSYIKNANRARRR